jgi:hypothetical protein
MLLADNNLNISVNSGDTSQTYIGSTGIFQVSGATNPVLNFSSSSGSAGIYSEGSFDVSDLTINSSTVALICMNGAGSCMHVRHSYGTNNSDDQIAVANGSVLKYDQTSGSVTYNKRVSSSSTLKVCTSGADYCKNGGGCCISAGAACTVGSPFAGTSLNPASCSSLPSTCSYPLAINLAYFKAQKSSEGVQIKWITALEHNSDYFIIEKSTNGLDWTEVSKVIANGGANGASYSTIDYSPSAGYNYYRLTEVEKSGKETPYAIDVVDIRSEGVDFHVFPNPSTGNITVTVSDDFPQYEFEIEDVKGVTIGTYTLFAGSNSLANVAKPGVYFAKLKVRTDMKIQKIVIQ